MRAQTGNDYVVQQTQYQNQYQNQNQNQYQGQYQQQAAWTRLGNAAQEPVQIPTYQLTGYAQGYSFSLQLTANYDRGRNYAFTQQVNLAGLILYSTDQVALFEGTSPGGGYALLKVAYRTQNPQLQEYFIDEISSGYNGGYYQQQNLGRRYHVVQRIMDTAFAYPQQQQQQYQQPYQQQQQQPSGQTNNDNPYF